MKTVIKRGSTEDILIVAIDMCSSSKLIDDLSKRQSLIAFDELLQGLYSWLDSNREIYKYEIYQFTGDGWILFFHDLEIDGLILMEFLVKLSQKHNLLRSSLIDVQLINLPESTGLTFGIDVGKLHQFSLGNENRCVGRALNVACKLQDAVKQRGPEAELSYRGLISNDVYYRWLKNREVLNKFTFFDRTRSLRNIDTKFRCRKVNLSTHI